MKGGGKVVVGAAARRGPGGNGKDESSDGKDERTPLLPQRQRDDAAYFTDHRVPVPEADVVSSQYQSKQGIDIAKKFLKKCFRV